MAPARPRAAFRLLPQGQISRRQDAGRDARAGFAAGARGSAGARGVTRKGATMAELTNLESKLGEVLGLAMAAQGATQKVKKLPELEDDLAQTLDRMHEEAAEAEERATQDRKSV